MLLVRTEVRPSSVHGRGVFALDFIPCGTVVWVLDRDSTLTLTRAQWAVLSASESDDLSNAFRWHGFEERGSIVVDLDDARYVNHSQDHANLACPPGRRDAMVTTRDVAAGEELLENYHQTIGVTGTLCTAFLGCPATKTSCAPLDTSSIE